MSKTIHWPVVLLCFLAVLLDGFDTAALSFTIPTLSHEWGSAPAAFTLPLVLTNIGVVMGYLAAGYVGARMKARSVILTGVLIFAGATVLTAAILHLKSMPVFAATRLVTGLGLGLVLPAGVSLATKHSAESRRELVSVAVTLGLASGSSLGGFFGGKLLHSVGSAGVFYVAGLAPLVLAAVMAAVLPAREPAVATTAKQEAKVSRLFGEGLRLPTSLIWAFSFLIFITAYVLISWVPTLLTGYGFAAGKAPLGLAFLTLGGIAGGLVLIPLAARIGITRALILMPAIGAVCMVLVATVPLGETLLFLLLAGAGFGVTAGQIGQLTLAVSIYPASTRTTGVGWAAALGRIGSIVGPGVAGLLLALALSAQTIVLATAVPVLVAIACAVGLSRVRSRARRERDGALVRSR
ncbi:MFS transporter [Amycolatopsis circi]|uniref:MFS transporter n=1 Tax=Amycolatopsis circi TaxID=871959 RepID=UPI000E251E70|nr:MFS transporter [Amycolatopsis circi]